MKQPVLLVAILFSGALSMAPGIAAANEALTGFDNRTNTFTNQATFDADRAVFESVETIADGIGPVYNGTSCVECHQNVVSGGSSQVTEHRSGRQFRHNGFFESAGGSLIQSRAISPELVEHSSYADTINTLRVSTSTLGDGFVEAIDDDTLLQIRDSQPAGVRGTAAFVPVLERHGETRIGRFGWKCQHASLESFAADAYLNEMGITSPLQPEENTSNGRDVSAWDHVPDPEDNGADVRTFAAFMRATKAPPRGAITSTVRSGEKTFADIGCAACHTPTITTSENPPIDGNRAALASKTIHPYSDFLLHDVGTGDGIPIDAGREFAFSANQMRTAPLWGVRTRNRLMHDGLSFTYEDAINRHGGQAAAVRAKYNALSGGSRSALLDFLSSL